MQDIQNRFNAAVRPTIADLDVAIKTILTELSELQAGLIVEPGTT